MKRSCGIGLLLLLGVAAGSMAGDIQIFCEPDLRILVDGEYVGMSTARDDGYVLTGIKRGRHTLRVEKAGFVPQTFEIDVAKIPIEIQVADLVPVPPEAPQPAQPGSPGPVEEQSTQLVGSLVVTSVPQNCVVEINGGSETKTTPQMTIGGLPAGEHRIVFKKSGYDPISGIVVVRSGSELQVRGNFKEGKVEVSHQGKGALRVLSKPSRCTIRFMGKIAEKTGSRLNLTQIPAGEYPIVVSIPGRQLSSTVLIMDQRRTVLEVSFVKGDEPFIVSHVLK